MQKWHDCLVNLSLRERNTEGDEKREIEWKFGLALKQGMSVTEGWRDAKEEKNKNTRASAVGRLVTLSGGEATTQKKTTKISPLLNSSMLCVCYRSL